VSSHYLILARSEITASALNFWLELLGKESIPSNHPQRIVWAKSAGNGLAQVKAYEQLVEKLEVAIQRSGESSPLNKTIVLVDAISPSQLHVASDGGDWSSLVAMLILTFPELYWCFGVIGECYPEESKEESAENTIFFPESSHRLVALFQNTFRNPLFDPTGLRQWIRLKTIENLEREGISMPLPVRYKRAAAIDEEQDYALLHGYTAYRFGCRTDTVSTWSLMQALFSGNRECSHGYWLLLEDMSLNFSDRESNVHLLNLERYADHQGKQQGRTEHCPLLDSSQPAIETSAHRILITTGQTQPRSSVLRENRAYLRRKARGRGAIVFKPASGMFDLWEKAGLLRKRGNVPGFRWPVSPDMGVFEGTGHGAPGKLFLIAETLTRRAERVLATMHSVTHAIYGAALSTDALELTGGRIPTTALHALRLKHEFEVLAECEFPGVEYEIKIKLRIREIDSEVRSICNWFHSRQQKPAALNVSMHILGHLLRVFREYGRFDEEQACMNKSRNLHNTLWIRQNPLRLGLAPILRYLEFLLASFPRFIVVLLCWILGLAVLYGFVDDRTLSGTWETLLVSIEAAVSSFLSSGPPIDHLSAQWASNVSKIGYTLVNCLAIISGFIHMGVFIAHLYYSLIRR
jgi:hypothetical protein